MTAFAVIASFAASACALVLGIDETTVRDGAEAAADTGDRDDATADRDGDPVTDDAGEDRDAIAIPLSPCPATSNATTFVVDAMKGDDAVAPSNGVAYRSITKALAAANAKGGAVPITVCVRGGASGSEVVYSEATTGEVFPLEIAAADVTLRGEGEAAVTIFYTGADASDASLGPIVVHVKGAATDAKVEGVRVKTGKGIGLFNEGPALTINDSTFTTAPGAGVQELIATAALVTITRTQTLAVNGSYACLAVRPLARAIVTDSVIDNCYGGIRIEPTSSTTATRVAFSRNQWAGFWAIGPTSFETKDCTFSSNFVGLLVDGLDTVSAFTGSSTGDSFKAHAEAAIRIETPSVPAGASLSITGAKVRLEQKRGLDIVAPLKVVLRGTSFEDVKGVAVDVRAPAVPSMLDFGGAGANNAFQSTIHPNKTGICLQAAGDLAAQGNGFAHCPTQSSADCNGGDVSAPGGGVIDTASCFVVP